MLHFLSAPLIATLLVAEPANPADGSGLAAGSPVEASATLAVPLLPTVAIDALLQKPELELGITHRAYAQFHGQRDDWEPFLTRFHADDYRCVTLWSDEQWLWIEEEYESPAIELFVRRGTDVDRALRDAKPHDRFRMAITVREMHAGRAWIEVTEAVPTRVQVPEGTVLHAIRAMEMIEREGWPLAVSELERALRPELPGPVRRELETLLELSRSALSR